MKQENSNYWTGFALGLLAGITLMYFTGTKKGREKLESFLKNADVLEHDLEDVLNTIYKTATLSKKELPTPPQQESTSGNLNNLIGKIKNIRLPKNKMSKST